MGSAGLSGLAPERVGRYEILRRLAVGGMGEIFLARERGIAGFDRLVVIKRLLPQLAGSAELVQMFLDEARIVAHLVHPGIAQVHELGVAEDGSHFQAMEYVPGENLARIMTRAQERGVAVPQPFRLHVLAEMTRALDFAHNARDAAGQPLGIVHRDVSPQNVMVTFHGDVKLMDFGVAKAHNRVHRTETGKVKGKIAYMAPEQLRGEAVNARSDVYSAGVMIWELTLGRRLFSGANEGDTFRRAYEAEVPVPRTIDPAYPEAMEVIVMAALDRDHQRRTATAGELSAALRAYLAGRGESVEREQLGAFVTGLFAAAEPEAAAESSAVATWEWAQRLPTRSASPVDTPTRPERIRATPAGAPGSAPAAAAPAPARSPWRRWALGLAVAAAGGAVALWILSGPRHDSESPSDASELAASGGDREPPPAAASAPGAGETAAAVEPLVPVDAAPIATADTGGPAPARGGRGHSRPPGRESGTRAPATGERPDPVEPRPPATAPEPVDPRPAPPEATGTLVVAAADDGVWGMASIDGQSPRQTPLQRRLPAGEFTVELTLPQGGGGFTGKARVAAGMRTVCELRQRRFTCRAPR